MTKRYDHANEERYGAAIEALDAAGKTGSAEALAAARWEADLASLKLWGNEGRHRAKRSGTAARDRLC
jgi:hypothetical protein